MQLLPNFTEIHMYGRKNISNTPRFVIIGLHVDWTHKM